MSYCIYLRKSRADTEAELRGEGETLARHERELTAFAKQKGLEVTQVYREIISGETISARPMMQRLLSEVSQGKWEGVIVIDVDRLARGNSMDQGMIAQTFLYSQTRIITPAKVYDPSNEFDEEYFEFGLFMSRREYKTINRRLQRGREASVKEGKYIGSKAPYGYKRIKLKGDKGYTLSPVPEQAEVVRSIFEWYIVGLIQADGKRKRIGTALIARELNLRSIKSPDDKEWTPQTIRDILINPTFAGKLRWKWRPQKKKMINGIIVTERPRCNDHLLYNGLHPAIIDERTFNAAAERMSKNKGKTVPYCKTMQNPLAGLMICAKCGRKMQRRPNTKYPDLLVCPAQLCDNHAVYLHLVEKHLLYALNKWTKGCIIHNTRKELSDSTEFFSSELSLLLTAEKKLNLQLEKAHEAFETEIYDADTFQCRYKAISQKLSYLTARKLLLQKNAVKEREKQRISSGMSIENKKISDAYYSITEIKAKNDMLKELVDHIDFIKNTRGHGHEEDFFITIYPKLPRNSQE